MPTTSDTERVAIRDANGSLRSPRIAIVIDKFDAARGGAARYTRDLVVWLVARGVEVHVVSGDIGDEERGLPLVFHGVCSSRGRHAFAATAIERVEELSVDISHDMGAAFGCDIFQSHVGSPVACQRAMDAAMPWWYRHARQLVQEFPRRRMIRRLAARQFGSPHSLFIAVSGRVADDLQRMHGVPPHRIRIIHNGVDNERFDARRHAAAGDAVRHRYSITADELLVVAVAHNYRLKGIHVLVSAVRRLRGEGLPLRLLVCGIPQTRSRAALPARECVVHAGCVTDIAACYAAADIAVQPSFYDACSLATLESLASGLPVITTRANGASELLTHGSDGIVLDDPNDGHALAAALRSLARNRFVRSSLGRAARRLAAAHGSGATFAAVMGVYAEVLAAKGYPLVRSSVRTRDRRSGAASTRELISEVPELSTACMTLTGLACGGYAMWRRRKRA